MKLAIILGNLGNTNDRFLSSGYKDQPTKEEMIKRAAAIESVEGVELVGSWDITAETVDQVGALLAKHPLKCVSIIPDHFAQKRWGNGAFSSKDASIRAQAVDETAKMAEAAIKLGCDLINLWPGQDGYDYPLQADYRQERLWLEEGVRSLCKSFPRVRFSLEYKPKEPRTHSYMARCGDTLLLAQRVALPNVGVTVDTGHSFVAGENVAEAAVMLSMAGEKLFHMHFNDNYRRVSTAGRLRMRAWRLSMRRAPSASVTVTTAGRPSGIAATATLMAVTIMSRTCSPRATPVAKITAEAAAATTATARASRARRRCSGVGPGGASRISRAMVPSSVPMPVATT